MAPVASLQIQPMFVTESNVESVIYSDDCDDEQGCSGGVSALEVKPNEPGYRIVLTLRPPLGS